MASLCHPWFTTTNFSYRFPIFETSATALCGTTGIQLYLYMDIGISILNHDSRSAIDIDNQHSYMSFHEWSKITHYKRKDKKWKPGCGAKLQTFDSTICHAIPKAVKSVMLIGIPFSHRCEIRIQAFQAHLRQGCGFNMFQPLKSTWIILIILNHFCGWQTTKQNRDVFHLPNVCSFKA